MTDYALCHEADGIVTVSLNRPRRLNALNEDLLKALIAQIEAVDASTRAVILKGEGRAFCSGHDLKDAGHAGDEPYTADNARRGAELMQAVTRALRDCPAPVIAVVHGYAIGGGAEIAFSCDMVIAAADTVFQFTETSVGLTITNGSSYLLPAVCGPYIAKELVMMGERFTAEDAQRFGLINRVVALDGLEAEVGYFADILRLRAPLAVQCVKRVMNRGMDADVEDAMSAEVEEVVVIELTEDAREATRAWVEDRTPTFVGR